MSIFVVAGIARSGTSFVYQRLGQALMGNTDAIHVNPTFRYEPYLWNIPEWDTKGHKFSNQYLNPTGIATHKETPLFTPVDASTASSHLEWIRSTFASAAGKPVLGKVVRGSGRIADYLAAQPDLRIVLLLRNPLDTANSLHSQFSVFGDEFFPSDWPRLHATEEFEALGMADNELSGKMGRTLAWWRTMTKASVQHAGHERVLAIPYEAIRDDPERHGETLAEFLHPYAPLGVDLDSNRAAGPVTQTRSLRREQLGQAKAALAEYVSYLEQLGYSDLADSLPSELIRRYAELDWRPGIYAFSVPRDMNPLQLRLHGENRCVEVAPSEKGALVLEDHLEQLVPSMRLNAFNVGRLAPGVVEGDSLFESAGCVITAHNDDDTLAAAINSVLDQTLPYNQVVVVDDASTDGTFDIAKHYENTYASVKALRLSSNVGPSAARGFGISELSTEFFSHLDADDVLWPTKNFEELAALDGSRTSIAFSDTLLCRQDGSVVLDSSPYEGLGTDELNLALLSRVPGIPRDMTMHRSLYHTAGGYDFVLSMFEDFDFKLRLSVEDYVDWRRSASPIGTLYNRSTAGLSQKENLVQVQNVLHVLARNRHVSRLSEDDFNNAVAEALDPFEFQLLRFFQMLLRYVGWSHYERLSDPKLLGYAGDQLIVELTERMTDVRAQALPDGLEKVAFRPASGFGRLVSMTTDAGRVEVREIIATRAKLIVDVPNGCRDLVLKLRRAKGVDTKLVNLGDYWQSTTQVHQGMDSAVLYPFKVEVESGETEIEIIGRSFESPAFGALNSRNAFLEGVYGVLR